MIVPGADVHLTLPKVPTRLQQLPARLVLHSIECPPDLNVKPAAISHPNPPHLWVSMPRQQIVQTGDTDYAARALHHPVASVETNHAGRACVQIEIAGYARDTPGYPQEWWEWLGEAVVGPLCRHHGIRLWAPPFVTYPQSYGVGAAQRYDQAAWYACDHVIGHEHVATNDHGDPGGINIGAVLRAAAGEDDDMPSIEEVDQLITKRLAEQDARTKAVVDARFTAVDEELAEQRTILDELKGRVSTIWRISRVAKDELPPPPAGQDDVWTRWRKALGL